MSQPTGVRILRGAHVIDTTQGIDRVVDVAIENGKIRSIGEDVPGAEVIDVSGCHLSAGWIDIHVHVYGTLGFADPDSIGVHQGVTTFIEAGSPGIDSLDEFHAVMEGRTKTRLYVGPYCMRPIGLISLNFIEGGDVRTLTHIPIVKWLDYMAEHGDDLRYLKIGAYGNFGKGAQKMAKGLAETLGRPLYIHIGEQQLQEGTDDANEIWKVADSGDIVTHVFTGMKYGVLGADGKVMPEVLAAHKRGVLFDVGMGGYNFAWDAAEKIMAAGLVPEIISSDLQQFNVLGPVYSLAHVMSACTYLGFNVRETIDRVTVNPARALALDDRAGSLKPGMPADITVFRVVSGEYEVRDTGAGVRTVNTKFEPVMAFKDGERIDCDMTRCQDDRNWLLQVADDRAPAAMSGLSARQRAFLAALRAHLTTIDWGVADVKKLNLPKVLELHDAFRKVVKDEDIPLRQALLALYDCFLHHPFAIQAGLFLLRMPRELVLARLAEAAPELAAH